MKASAKQRERLEYLFREAVEAVHPRLLLPRLVRRTAEKLDVSEPAGESRWAVAASTPVIVIGAGKGSALVAAELERIIGPQLQGGLVIVPDGYEGPLSRVRLVAASHPVPDRRGVAATRDLLSLLRGLEPGVAVIGIITGGASSLMVAPAAGLTLSDKKRVTDALLKSGASIAETNAVRKHLSAVKGGQLARLLVKHPLLTLVVSDVMGDDPAVIGSGPTVADASTFADAVGVLRHYGLWNEIGGRAREHLEKGLKGGVAETPKPGGEISKGGVVMTMATNDTARRLVVKRARSWGWLVRDLGCVLEGDTAGAARWFVSELHRAIAESAVGQSPMLVIAGGETTVKVRGGGLGGRNQEFALVASKFLGGSAPVSLLSAGTDGIDGPTDAAGAFSDETTVSRARSIGLDPDAFLARHDSYNFFSLLGDIFKPGPTGVNVMDLKLAIAGYPSK